jgi:hypothetical protein
MYRVKDVPTTANLVAFSYRRVLPRSWPGVDSTLFLAKQFSFEANTHFAHSSGANQDFLGFEVMLLI